MRLKDFQVIEVEGKRFRLVPEEVFASLSEPQNALPSTLEVLEQRGDETFGEFIVRARNSLRVKQKDLAKEAGLSQPHLCKIETKAGYEPEDQTKREVVRALRSFAQLPRKIS